MVFKTMEIPHDQQWVAVSDRLPIDGVDDGSKFIVAVRQKWDERKGWEEPDYFVCDWYDKSSSICNNPYPKHDGQRVKTYGFDFDWDIDEGQEIEVTHWRELPEFAGLDGKTVNLSRITHTYEQGYDKED